MIDIPSMLGRPAEILLVEDNENDRYLTERAFRVVGSGVRLHFVDDGDRCLSYLRREDEFSDAVRPDLILLDLNMPRMNGREVMQRIRGDEGLRSLPVIVLTTSDAERDRREMYDLRCSSYITKPIHLDEFEAMIVRLCEYWFSVVTLPPR